jgi:hypothetical protein
MGLAIGFATVLLLMYGERTLNGALRELSYGTPWEGLVAGFAWGTLLLLLPGVALVAWLGWRALCFAVLEGRLSARVAHKLSWSVLAMGMVCALLLTGAVLTAPSTTLARQLSIFLGDYAVPTWLVYGGYALVLIALGALTGPAPPRLPPLVVVTLRPPGRRRWFSAHELHRLAATWGEARGPVVLVRPAARAPLRAGLHARWAAFNGRLDELFVSDEHGARRWCAAWLGDRAPRAPGLFVRECFVREAGALSPLVATLSAQHPQTLFMLVLGREPDAAWLEELRHALPKQHSFTLAEPDNTLRVPRLSSLAGSLGSPRRLARALEQQMREPPARSRIAVLGRPRRDALADRLVMALDQRKDAQGRLIDALRPAREDLGAHETLLLLVDVAWLAGEREACHEAAALGVLAAGARRLAVVTDFEVSEAQLARALSVCASQVDIAWYGTLPPSLGDAPAWELAAQRIAAGAPLPLLPAPLPGCVRVHVSLDADEPLHSRLSHALEDVLGIQRVLSSERADEDAELLVVVLTPEAVRAMEHGSSEALLRPLGGALLRAVRVLPVLVGGARMPRGGLDASLLHRLAEVSVLRLPDEAGAEDLQRLVDVVCELLKVRPAPADRGAASVLLFRDASEASTYALPALEKTLLALQPNLRLRHGDEDILSPADLVVVLVDANVERWLHSPRGGELAFALRWEVPVLCVLLDDARLPSDLPPQLATLAQAPTVRCMLREGRAGALDEVQRAAHLLLRAGLGRRGASSLNPRPSPLPS